MTFFSRSHLPSSPEAVYLRKKNPLIPLELVYLFVCFLFSFHYHFFFYLYLYLFISHFLSFLRSLLFLRFSFSLLPYSFLSCSHTYFSLLPSRFSSSSSSLSCSHTSFSLLPSPFSSSSSSLSRPRPSSIPRLLLRLGVLQPPWIAEKTPLPRRL